MRYHIKALCLTGTAEPRAVKHEMEFRASSKEVARKLGRERLERLGLQPFVVYAIEIEPLK